MSTSNIDWAEIQTYFTGASPIGINEYYANGSYVNTGQLKSGGSAWATSGQISAADFSGVYYQWNNSNVKPTLAFTTPQYGGATLRFEYSNGGADTGNWSNPHCRLLPKWNDTGASGSGVAQNRVCLLALSTKAYLTNAEIGPTFEILTPNGNNGTTNQTGNSNWTRIRYVGDSGNVSVTLNRTNATYTNVGNAYGYTTASGYSLERWQWAASYANTNSNSSWTGYVYIEK